MHLRKLVLIILFFAIAYFQSLFSQNNFESINQEYVLDNPAFFFEDDDFHFSLFRKQQWNNLQTNNTLVTQKSVSDERLMIGLIFRNNNFTSSLINNDLSLPISYRINFAKGKLSMGLEPKIGHESLNGDNLYSPQSNDPFFHSQQQTNFNLNTGFYYSNESFNVGFSFKNLIQLDNILFHPYSSFLIGKSFNISRKLSYHTLVWIRLEDSNVHVTLRNQIKYSNLFNIALLIDQSKKLSLSTGIHLKHVIPRFSENISIYYGYGKHLGTPAILGTTNELGISYTWNHSPSKEKIKNKKVIHSPILFD